MNASSRLQEQIPLLGVADQISFAEQTKNSSRDRKNQEMETLPKGVDCALTTLFCLTFPIVGCCSTVRVVANQDTIISTCGVPTRVLREPNVYCINPFCTEVENVYMAGYAETLERELINDSAGTPLSASGMYGFTRTDSLSATYNTKDFFGFIRDQAKITFRSVLNNYPFDDPEHSDLSLRYSSDTIYLELQKSLEKSVKQIGVRINYFKITSIGVVTKMQKILLARQEAEAYIKGRKLIAEGAIGIIENTFLSLKKKGIELSHSEKTELIADLIYMFCTPDKFFLKINKNLLSMTPPLTFKQGTN